MAGSLPRAVGRATAWLRRWLMPGVGIAMAIYALGIVIAQQRAHTYPAIAPRALEDTLPKEMALDTFLESSKRPLNELLGHGWYGIEPGSGRWSAGLSSDLTIPEQSISVDLDLRLRLLAASDGEHATNPTRVLLNGRELALLDVAVNRMSDYVVRLPASMHQGYSMLVVLSYSFAVQPRAEDSRHIAIQLEGIELRRARN
ncbi:MAG: hypothetical protein RL685_1788 [Pseudomonadota bacterium]|jgi:hypothetical protein